MTVAHSTARTYHHGDLRRALLDATRELLVEGGIEAATLRAVARRAGVSNRAPYHHFADKCCLLAAVATEGFENLCREMDRSLAAATDEPVARLQALSYAYLDFARNHPGEFQVMFWHEVCDPEAFRDRGEKAAEALRYLLDSIESLAPKPMDRDELMGMAVSAWSTLHGFATLEAQGAFREHGPGKAEAHKSSAEHTNLGDERLADEVCSRIAASLAAEIRQ